MDRDGHSCAGEAPSWEHTGIIINRTVEGLLRISQHGGTGHAKHHVHHMHHMHHMHCMLHTCTACCTTCTACCTTCTACTTRLIHAIVIIMCPRLKNCPLETSSVIFPARGAARRPAGGLSRCHIEAGLHGSLMERGHYMLMDRRCRFEQSDSMLMLTRTVLQADRAKHPRVLSLDRNGARHMAHGPGGNMARRPWEWAWHMVHGGWAWCTECAVWSIV